jgi:hypothetical protein
MVPHLNSKLQAAFLHLLMDGKTLYYENSRNETKPYIVNKRVKATFLGHQLTLDECS